MKTKQQILNYLNEMDESEVLEIWNSIAFWNGAVEPIYSMDDLDDLMGKMYPSEFLSKIDRDFKDSDCYFYDTIWGITSTDDIYDVVDLDELAELIADNWEEYTTCIYELNNFMDEVETEE